MKMNQKVLEWVDTLESTIKEMMEKNKWKQIK